MSAEETQIEEVSPGYLVGAGELDVPPGYKRTEAGVIPEDWACVCVGDVAKVKGGKRLPAGYVLTDIPTAHPYIRVSDMFNGGVNMSEIKYVPERAFPAIQRYRILDTDVFISVAGTLGIVGVVPSELSGANLTENADCISDISCERDYLKYWLMSQPIQKTIESIQTVGAQPKLALGRIAKFDVAIPCKPAEQRAIAEALSDVDGLIDSLDTLIAKKSAIKQAAMQQLLTGKTRLPGFSKEWEMKRLGEMAYFYKGKGLPKSALSDSGEKSCIHYGELFTFYQEVIKEIASRTNYAESVFRSRRNDVLMPTSDVTPRGLAKASCVLNDDIILGGDILIIRSDPNIIHGPFLSYLIRYEEKQILQLVTGSTVYHLYGSEMEKFTFSVPDLEEQVAITTVLSDMDAELTALEKRLGKARELKQGMMQQLLTGRVRLIQPERAA